MYVPTLTYVCWLLQVSTDLHYQANICLSQDREVQFGQPLSIGVKMEHILGQQAGG